MKNQKNVLIITLLLFTLPLFSQNKTIDITSDYEKEGGFILEINKAAFEKMGYTVNISLKPWARALTMVMTGKVEVLFGAKYTDERAEKMAYSPVVATSEMVLFKLKENNISYNSMSDLKDYKIGTIIYGAYPEIFSNATFLDKVPVSDFQTNIKKLIAKRVDLFIEKKDVVLYSLKTEFPESVNTIDYITTPIEETKYYTCFSKDIPGYEEKLNDFIKGLQMIKNDGTYDKIMALGLHE